MTEEQVAGFRLQSTTSHSPRSPEGLFQDLRGREPEVKHLWAHQADILRTYTERFADSSNVALQLPTGSGKTLVGLLIAEWRRVTRGDRVLYVCPTRQLAHQVNTHAQKYGIKTRVLVGRQTEYPPADHGDYVTAEAIAITTYSSVFNYNPRLDDAQTLILDDAHAAETYVADAWTVRIHRSSALYYELLDLFSPGLSPGTLAQCRAQSYQDVVDAVPIPRFMPLSDTICGLLNSREDELDNQWWSWLMIRDHLQACNVFVSWSEIVMRPFIPPTETHDAFRNANQRVYMSATLGESGELERLFGVHRIRRIPLPGGLDRQAIGRRLVLFPDRSLARDDALDVALEAIARQPRSLVLCPTVRSRDEFTAAVQSRVPGHEVLGADDVEHMMSRFTAAQSASLVLANRYDGLDLADEGCRLQILYDLPSATNLQERFLWSRLNATCLLKERVRTRLVQALGRCTRNATDYAAVILTGRELFDFCARSENLQGLHPELVAEIRFGLEQSADRLAPRDFLDLLAAFWEQGDDWANANSAILDRREEVQPDSLDHDEALSLTCSDEVNYQYNLWNGNLVQALESGRRVCDRLGGESLHGYRGFWYYLTGSVAWLMSTEDDVYPHNRVAMDFFERAAAASHVAPWLARLSRLLAHERGGEDGQSEALSDAVSRLVERLIELGLVGERFEQEMDDLLDSLGDCRSELFERGLVKLGHYLGLESDKPGGNAAPDAVWELPGHFVVALEAKSESRAERISVQDLRQAGGHMNWLAAHRDVTSSTPVVVLITPHSGLDPDAAPHSSGVYHVGISDLRERARSLAGCLRRARSEASDRETLARQLSASLPRLSLSPDSIVEWLTRTAVANLDRE